MRKSLNILITTIMILVVATTAAYAADDAAATMEPDQPVVNINDAVVSDLALLPRIGEKIAQRIIDYRTDHGAFQKETDLMQVKGIGEKTFELLRPYLVLDGETTLKTKQKVSRNRPAGSPSRAVQ